jgi:putative DNA-invertase from lambdoid prophage Rac
MTPQTTSPRVAIYARVSTVDQNNEVQIRELSEHAARRGWEVAATITDQISGAKAKRPGLDELMRLARLRKIDCVMVWKLDRFGRSVAQVIANVQELVSLGVRFMAVTQNIDTDESNPMSRFLMHIMAAFAELEREIIRERVNAGLQYARVNGTRSGNAIGRPKRVFNRERAREMRESGRSWSEIAEELGVGTGTVRRACGAT